MASTIVPMEPEQTPPAPAVEDGSSGRDGMFAISIAVALMAMLGAVIAVGFGWRAIDESQASASSGGSGPSDDGGAPAMVSLTEFAVTPASVGVSGTLHAMNDGAVAHNLAVEGTDLRTAELAGGADEALELGDLAPGTYTMICEIPGHREAGMEAELTVTEGGGGGDVAAPAGDHDGHSAMDYQKMTDDMLASMNAFPAETEGKGNTVLEPTEVLADGTKVFDLTMEPGKWEVEPGKVVDAFTFNGIVPAPMLNLAVGDKVAVRVQNDLPMATDVHWHGLNVRQRDGWRGPLHPGPHRAGRLLHLRVHDRRAGRGHVPPPRSRALPPARRHVRRRSSSTRSAYLWARPSASSRCRPTS